MILGSYRRIYTQDYSQENQADIDTLSISLNQSFESIYECLTNQITFKDNVNCTIVSFDTSVNSKNVPNAPVVLKLNSFQKNVTGIWVINAVSKNNNLISPTSGIFMTFSINNNITSSSNVTNTGNTSSSALTVNITNIVGLPANTPFTITAIII